MKHLEESDEKFPVLGSYQINVTVHDDTLAIEGELRFSVPENAKPIWQEFGPSKFRRSLRLGSAGLQKRWSFPPIVRSRCRPSAVSPKVRRCC